jgi:DNA-binding HxlR family transcriptional regulator
VLLAHLKDGAFRYRELRGRIPRLSDKILTERLRDLITRRKLQGSSPYFTYELTPFGQSLRPVLEALYEWGETAAPTLGVKVEMVASASRHAVTEPTIAAA